MKTIGYLVLVAVTQAVPPLALVRLSHAWSGSHSISIAAVDRLTVPILLIGASGLVLGARGIYRTLRRVRPRIAIAVTVVLWVPLTLSAATYFYALLVFRSWV